MNDMRLGAAESHFAEIVWKNAPLTTASLVKLCEAELHWKRTTTYTVLKRLSERGLFENRGGTVVALLSREDYYSLYSENYVDDVFNGSLPAFLVAFTRRKKLSEEELDQLQQLIDESRR